MLRGVNRQDLFHDDDDRYKFIDALMQIVMPTDDNGNPVESYCTIFAWCLMSNHIHLLIQEKTEPIGDTIKRVTVSYAYYYNRKYGRESTLFHDRFRSEPCNDYAYFWRLIRYIHRSRDRHSSRRLQLEFLARIHRRRSCILPCLCHKHTSTADGKILQHNGGTR